MRRLAIVIPAFKSMYFEQVLMSVASQTNKNFTLYIGDDASPQDFNSLLEPYRAKMNIVYKRFETNLGGSDLVAQWERCIDMIEEEEWIWLFSDDDRMDPHCVERFYETLEDDPGYDLYHFNVREIDTSNKIVGRPFPFPKIMTPEEFLLLRLKGEIFSSAVEYVFRKEVFHALGRFKNFDLAWGSDDATWMTMGRSKGIRHIDEAKVYWRRSQLNISPNYSDSVIIERKIRAQIEFVRWTEHQVALGNIHISLSNLQEQAERWFLRAMRSRMAYISKNALHALLDEFYDQVLHTKPPGEVLTRYQLYSKYNQVKAKAKQLFRGSISLHFLGFLLFYDIGSI